MANGALEVFNSLLPSYATERVTGVDRLYPERVINGLPSYLEVTMSNGGLLNGGKYDAWCADPDLGIATSTFIGVFVYSSYDTVPSTVVPAMQVLDDNGDGYQDRLQAVNWVLNNITEPVNVTVSPGVYTKYTYDVDLSPESPGAETFTLGDVQLAIWKLLGYTNFTDSNYENLYGYDTTERMADSIVELAINQGSTFVPVAGDDIAVILSPGASDQPPSSHPPSQQPTIIEVGTAGIGDTVFADCNKNGEYDLGEGIDGVTVKLLANKGDGFEVVATTVTGDNPNTGAIETGYYSFGPLLAGPTYDATGGPGPGITYRVMVDTSTLPGVGWVNTIDPDGDDDSMSEVTLKPGEVNLEQDFGYAAQPVCVSYDFSEMPTGSGSSRTYETDGVSVTATAWSREKSNGNWDKAYLGAYDAGLGVTDYSGGDSHTVDNMGSRDNYVVFQFSQDVIVDSAYLGYVVCDSDISVWIGSSPTEITDVSDALLAGLTLYEENWTDLSSPRLAEFNAGNVSGNVLIIAANTSDCTPEDRFKIEKLDVCTAVVCKASIGDSVWLDSNNNGIQDDDEEGVDGVTVNLLNSAGLVLDTTTTNASGAYLFSDLTTGKYAVQVVAPTGFDFAKQDQGTNDAKDSDVDSTGKTVVTTLSPGEYDMSWDAGLVAVMPQDCRTIVFTGGTETGSCNDGNIRSYNFDGLAVNVSAFSSDKSGGSWQTAYLGSYGGGLGVTDRYEGSGGNNKHTVDNTGGRDNYVLFEFNQQVVLDKAYLGYVVGDSDLQLWVGNFTNPYNNHLSLNSATLSSMGFTEVNTTTLTSARWADLNANEYLGNTIVIAADTTDCTPEDYFKIQKLEVCTTPTGPALKAGLGDRVWCDTNGDGIQGVGELGVKDVTVNLFNKAGVQVSTTRTGVDGEYNFANLNPGEYKVQIVKPNAYGGFTVADKGNDAKDSDVDSNGWTGPIALLAGTNDVTSGGAGLTPPQVNLTYNFCGSSALDGTDGNIRTFSAGSGAGAVSVKTSAFSSDKNGADWQAAYLGNYNHGLGVTDKSEGSGGSNMHMVDNVGRDNYVLFRFSETVTVDTVSLGYVVNDSDMTVWIGNISNAFTNSITLSASVLNGLGFKEVNYGSDSARVADINAGNVAGNVLVVAAWTEDSTPEDRFKIDKLKVSVASKTVTPIAIDLDGNGIQTTSLADAQGEFDLFGTGGTVKSGWLSAGDAFLAFDADGNGRIDDISELFGGSKQGDGFARLASFDSNGDGLVDAADEGYADLSVWRDANGNHQTDAGELISLADAGVASLKVAYHEEAFWDASGNLHLEQSSATLADGSVVDMTDLYFSAAANDGAAAAAEVPVSDPGWMFG